MKKVLKITVLILVCSLFSVTSVFASTNTKVRTESDYLVSDWVTVTESNKNNILSTPAVDASEKVYDFADLFTDSDEASLYSEIMEYIDSYYMDLAVVTINTNTKTSPQVYADDFYDYNEFGINSSRDGILFLIDMSNREIYMSTTGKAINMYNDYRIEKALDAVYTYMSDGKYYDGVSRYVDIISDYASKGYPNGDSSKISIVNILLYSFIGSLVITVIIMFILIRKNKLVRTANTAEEYLKKDSVNINKLGDIFINSNTVKHKIEHESSSGSSTHSSSSGSSHGGGGHGF